MKKTRFTESLMVTAMLEQESGMFVKEICRDLGIREPTFYNPKAKYGGMDYTKEIWITAYE